MDRKLENAVNLYMEGIRDGNYEEAVNKYTGGRYTQHSTGVKDGKEGFIEFFSEFVKRNPIRDIRIIRKLVDGQFVFVQAYQDINKGQAKWVTMDFFDTDENDRIIEHWDVISEYTGRNASGHTCIDGAVELCDLDRTDENKEIVRNMLKDAFMEGGDKENLNRYISEEKYIRHAKDAVDGIEAFEESLRVKDSATEYKEIVLLVGQGNFVAALSRVVVTQGGLPLEIAKVDVFRLEGGFVVEHWENWEPVPKVHANSGKF